MKLEEVEVGDYFWWKKKNRSQPEVLRKIAFDAKSNFVLTILGQPFITPIAIAVNSVGTISAIPQEEEVKLANGYEDLGD
jgi:hypothetical protein